MCLIMYFCFLMFVKELHDFLFWNHSLYTGFTDGSLSFVRATFAFYLIFFSFLLTCSKLMVCHIHAMDVRFGRSLVSSFASLGLPALSGSIPSTIFMLTGLKHL